jgi:hypothetical protein
LILVDGFVQFFFILNDFCLFSEFSQLLSKKEAVRSNPSPSQKQKIPTMVMVLSVSPITPIISVFIYFVAVLSIYRFQVGFLNEFALLVSLKLNYTVQ